MIEMSNRNVVFSAQITTRFFKSFDPWSESLTNLNIFAPFICGDVVGLFFTGVYKTLKYHKRPSGIIIYANSQSRHGKSGAIVTRLRGAIMRKLPANVVGDLCHDDCAL